MSAREKTQKKTADKSAQKGANKSRGFKKRAAKPAAAEGSAPKKRKSRTSANEDGKPGRINPFEYILPVISLAVALVGSVMLFRHYFIEPKEAAAEAAAAAAASANSAQTVAQTNNSTAYNGVADPWNAEGYFTTGYADLDEQVKAFCDALSVEGNNARQNAQLAFNQIMWSTYEGRTDDQKPSGDGWEVASARHFFSTGSPKDGIGGSGDYYEYAAATSFCLRYFGYWDAFATPALTSNQESIAVCLVTDENGYGCVCDPTYGAEGWMLNRSMYTVTVEDLGQDLTKVEALGLRVVNTSAVNTQADNANATSATAANGSKENESGTYDETYGYVDESYAKYY